MEKVRERIRGYINKGVIKTEGIKKIRKEFKLEDKKIMELWLEEREKLQPPKRPANKRNNEEWMNVRIKKKDLKIVMEFLSTL